MNVTLKRGVAHIGLEPANSVSLPQLRRIIKDAGYTTRDAVVTARGTLSVRADMLVVDVTGTSTSLVLAADPTAPGALATLRNAASGSASTRVEITGTVTSPGTDKKQEDTLLLRSFTINP